jgi:hypothetical protein
MKHINSDTCKWIKITGGDQDGEIKAFSQDTIENLAKDQTFTVKYYLSSFLESLDGEFADGSIASKRLTSVDLSKLKTDKLASMSKPFEGLTNLKSVNLPKGLTDALVSGLGLSSAVKILVEGDESEDFELLLNPKEVTFEWSDSDIEITDDNETVSVTVTPSEEAADLVYESSAPEVVTVDENGVISIVGTGEADVKVKVKEASEDYYPRYKSEVSSVHITVVEKLYKITISENELVTISAPEDTVLEQLKKDAEVEFTVSVEESAEKELDKVLVDDKEVELSEDNKFTVSVAKADHTISATTKIRQYTVTLRDNNISVDENQSLTVDYGTSVEFTISVPENHAISAVKANDEDITKSVVDNKFIYEVKYNVTLSVEFEESVSEEDKQGGTVETELGTIEETDTQEQDNSQESNPTSGEESKEQSETESQESSEGEPVTEETTNEE